MVVTQLRALVVLKVMVVRRIAVHRPFLDHKSSHYDLFLKFYITPTNITFQIYSRYLVTQANMSILKSASFVTLKSGNCKIMRLRM